MYNTSDKQNGFYVNQVDAGCYSVRLNIVGLLSHIDLVREFHRWMLTRSPEDRVYIYLENGACNNLWLTQGGFPLRNLIDIITAIKLTPAYDNLVLIVDQMLTGAASYLVLSTPKVKWGVLGCASFDAWMCDKSIEEYSLGERPYIKWIRDLFREGVKLNLYTEQEVEDHEKGRIVTLGLN